MDQEEDGGYKKGVGRKENTYEFVGEMVRLKGDFFSFLIFLAFSFLKKRIYL